MAVDRQQVEQFLYHEAQLMDEHRYDEWLALWNDPALYWVPSNRDEADPRREILIGDAAFSLQDFDQLEVGAVDRGKCGDSALPPKDVRLRSPK